MKDVNKWAFAIGVVILIIVGVVWIIFPAEKMIERKILVNSHQYKEGMADRSSTLRASLAEINAGLVSLGDNESQLGNELLAQKSTITVQLNTIRR